MRTHSRGQRSGITLTEILIAILIMGVGLVSLATLFPIGLVRLHEANRMTRATLLAESAMADMNARDLLNKNSFLSPLTNPFTQAFTPDPWRYDTPAAGQSYMSGGTILGAYATWGPGLPVAYDPLWRASVPNGNYTTNPNFGGYGYYYGLDASEARFGSGLGFIRPDSGATTLPSAHGLQRLTNFNPYFTPPAAPANGNYVLFPLGTVANIFVSPEDIVFQNKVNAAGQETQAVSTIVPDLSLGATGPTNEWRYTWMFTGQQADDDGTIFEGDLVIFENRPFSMDPVNNAPYASQMAVAAQAAGETVVEGIFGFSPYVSNGYAVGANRTVLLRWPNTMPDPDVRVASWIADVTYERNAVVTNTRFNGPYPGQRCNWYQVVKKSTAADETTGAGLGVSGFRAMTVWVGSDLKAKTQLAVGGVPFHPNAALVCPYVIYTFPKTIYTRN